MITEHDFTNKKDEVIADIEFLAACRTGIERADQIDALQEIKDTVTQAMLSLEKEGEENE